MNKRTASGFTLMEMLFSMMIVGMLLIAIMGIFTLYQKSSIQTGQFTGAQQNARIAVDFITDHIRQAGVNTDYSRGQRLIVHADLYQMAFNADMDHGQALPGLPALDAINRAFSPNKVPPTGTTIYAPQRVYDSEAETVVLTLDSDNDGTITGSDQGDEPEENGLNNNLFVLKKVVYGFDGGGNVFRSNSLALVRGGGAYPDGTYPPPLFQYLYDHDDDATTPDKLWGDDNPENGVLTDNEIAVLTAVPDSLLGGIRKVRINVVSESDKYNPRFADNNGFSSVQMRSDVYVRNSIRSKSLIYGYVFQDADGDGLPGTNESGIPNVEIRTVGLNRSTKTNSQGFFSFPLSAGAYTIKEFDPPGHTSTTPNVVSVNVGLGAAVGVNFGDVSSSPIGYILGTVFDDLDQDGVEGPSEVGIEGVSISLDSGERIFTNINGEYQFAVPIGNYNVVETDLDGYGSTTSNAVPVDLMAGGDSVVVDFGDVANPNFGTIDGFVYLDDNQNMLRDVGEEGLSNVALQLSTGDSSRTDATGYYKFSVPPGTKYSVTEVDPAGHLSTTVNTYKNIDIVPDTVVTRNFGDILDVPADFVEIQIGNAERALSVRAIDMDEDTRNDTDIIVGSPHKGGLGNLLVYYNEWEYFGFAISQLFGSSPTYSRDAFQDVTSITSYDFNGDALTDVLTGLDYSAGNNTQVWGNGGGTVSLSPDFASPSSGSTIIFDTKVVDVNNDGKADIILGLKNSSGTFTGGFEILSRNAVPVGPGAFTSTEYVTTAGPLGTILLGQVWAVDTGDIDADGDLDIFVASRTADYAGYIDIYKNVGLATGQYEWHARYRASGGINDLIVLDMYEDDTGDLDVITAISTGPNAGGVYLWLQDDLTAELGVPTGFPFGGVITENIPNDYFDGQGEVYGIKEGYFNPDLFPDIIVGTKKTDFYTGEVFLLKTFGGLPTNGEQLNSGSTGEVVSIDVGDFNKDNRLDSAVATRTALTQGKLVIYFNLPQ